MKKYKTNQNKILKGSKGITLIALVITIIVLLILAAVSIATLTGDNGILTKAQTAKDLTNKENAKEKVQVAVLGSLDNNGNIDLNALNENLKNVEGITSKLPIDSLPTTVTVDGYEIKIEADGTVTLVGESGTPGGTGGNDPITLPTTDETMPWLPEGTKSQNGDLDNGLVIVDKNNNEWVWVEVPKNIYADSNYNEGTKPSGETDYNKIEKVLKAYADPYTKGSASQIYDNWKDEYYDGCGIEENGDKTASQVYEEMYHTMLTSIYKNGGFWIGRYEAGIEGTTESAEENPNILKLGRTDSSARIDISTSPKAISQKNAIPYNYVYCSEAQKLASQMTPDNSKTSSLLFGIQWDLVCKFIEEKEVAKLGEQGETQRKIIVASINSDSYDWGNYKNVSLDNLSPNAKSFTTNNNTWSKILGNKASSNSILLSTGASEKTNRMNIYDFAGNEFEWTLENAPQNTNSPCSRRGGDFSIDSSGFPASYRYYYNKVYTRCYDSFRPALY